MTQPCIFKHPLDRDGTSQEQRFLQALEPGYVRIHAFTLADWMKFAWHYAEKLKFFGASDDINPAGNWQPFWKNEAELTEYLKDAALAEDAIWLKEEERQKIGKREPKMDFEPHLALYLSFLKLLKFPVERLNDVTHRHLHFYYEEVLKLSRQPAVPDRVHLVFELAKNATEALIKSGTLFDAGKDATGKPLQFAAVEELVVNPAKVASLKAIYHSKGKYLKFAAKEVDEAAGSEEEGVASWNPFGSDAWPAAFTGFSLASPILQLSEGKRLISVTLTLKSSHFLHFPDAEIFGEELHIFLTGKDKWIESKLLKVNLTPGKKETHLTFFVFLNATIPAICPYNASVHGGHFTTKSTLMRILINAGSDKGYHVWANLSQSVLTKATIAVKVTGMSQLNLENDLGRIDPAKPFYPFGPRPGKNARFYVGCEEALLKNWSQIKLTFTWKDKPSSLVEHYNCYRTNNITGADQTYDITSAPALTTRKIQSEDQFTVLAQYTSHRRLFPGDETGSQDLFGSGITVNPDPGSGISTSDDRVRLTLEESFLHEHYARIYSMAAMARSSVATTWLPMEPYAPQAASVSLGYDAETEHIFVAGKETVEEKFSAFAARKIQLFHETPFGQSEQHLWLKSKADFLSAMEHKMVTLAPRFADEGEFYIGLKDAAPSSILSLLFQILEGSENPMAPTFNEEKKINWYALVSNEWKPLNKSFLLGDRTNNFLKEGIIRFLLPPAINNNNTLLDDTLFWLRAVLPEDLHHTSVCKMTGVTAQAVEAECMGRNFGPTNREATLLAGIIEKMVEKPAAIKKIIQPSASFGGVAPEDDKKFRRRISERLRHKNRSITIWDYEHLVLQHFPKVYKVKCVSHASMSVAAGTKGYSEFSPGDVSLVVIPDIRTKESYDPLQPRASRNLLQEIDAFLKPLNSLHVRAHAVNPGYETVFLDFRVKFHENYDPNAYLKILDTDLIRYLSPWAFGDFSGIHFGGTVHQSLLIRFVENRPYVDFVSHFKMYRRISDNDLNTMPLNEISASAAGNILVSARHHKIGLIDKEKVCNE